MFTGTLKRENSPLSYEFTNAVFVVESFNYDVRRAEMDVRVIGFADEYAYNAYKAKLEKNEYHDLERSMVLNRSFSVKKADVDAAVDTLSGAGMVAAIEAVLQATEPIFQNA
ncbi:MAG: hypothetical protein CVT92_02430 [Bacteroidetes bacterium HGW-Bacteroidetes-1]|jgi:tetrahydromethanopterin S-methyltransferase subunit H|nr:MAG: hypothetical protein CVT92_02430 [Bacteroidetes bacterium HGW-Bacteroidetes-1]